jgi:hypothetical protein
MYTDKELKDFSDKVIEGYSKAVPKHLMEDKPINEDKEKSFSNWIERLRNRLGWNKKPI